MINKLLEECPQVKHICFGCDQCDYEEHFAILFPADLSEDHLHDLLLHYLMEVFDEKETAYNI